MSRPNLDAMRLAHVAALAKAETETRIYDAVNALLPAPEELSICLHAHKDTQWASVSLGSSFRAERSFAEAAALLECFAGDVVMGERWRSSCLSSWPAEINSEANNPRATLTGVHAVEIETSRTASDHYAKLRVWTRAAGMLLHVSIPFRYVLRLPGHPGNMLPHYSGGRYDTHGHFSGGRVEVQSVGEDARVSWWSEAPSFHVSLFWADLHNWRAFAGSVLP